MCCQSNEKNHHGHHSSHGKGCCHEMPLSKEKKIEQYEKHLAHLKEKAQDLESYIEELKKEN